MIETLIFFLFWILICAAFLTLCYLVEWIISKAEKAEEKRKQSELKFEQARQETRARINRNTTFLNCLMDGLRQD